ncbi:hypothetical protein GCM10022247_09840 [Allokutzneria multivorans]|uniref:Uncharacterized protein n=1 Tax=Allokutzneria multivorans TaxID=1142134 RepID=A0ABP7R527_9PSEU
MRAKLPHPVHHEATVVTLSDNLDVTSTRQDHSKTGSNEILVIDQQNFDHGRLPD